MKDTVLQLRLSEKEKKSIKRIAKEKNTSISQLLRSFIHSLESLEALSINK